MQRALILLTIFLIAGCNKDGKARFSGSSPASDLASLRKRIEELERRVSRLDGKQSTTEVSAKQQKGIVPFESIVVNMKSERASRFLKVTILIVCEETATDEVDAKVTKMKPLLKNWVIGHLSDQSIADLTGQSAQDRIRKEILQRFNEVLYPGAASKLRDVLFEEFVMQ